MPLPRSFGSACHSTENIEEPLARSRQHFVHDAAIEKEIRIEVVVMVPRGMVDVHKTHSALYHAPGQQTVPRERFEGIRPAAALRFQAARFAVHTVSLEGFAGFARKVC